MDKEQEAFEKWCLENGKSIDGHACAKERQITWKARAALDMSDELAKCLKDVREVLRSKNAWVTTEDLNEFIDEALNKYRERKI